MQYSLYTQLLGNGVNATDARKFCTILDGIPVNSNQVSIEGNTYKFHSDEAIEDMDVYSTMAFLDYPQDGEKIISGYHIGKGYFNTNFQIDLNGKYTVWVYDRRRRGLFDTNSELWILTNKENVLQNDETPESKELPHCYHFTPSAVDELQGRTKGTDDYFGSLDVITVDRFVKYGINPDSITIMPNTFDPYTYVGNFVADKDYKKEAVPK